MPHVYLFGDYALAKVSQGFWLILVQVTMGIVIWPFDITIAM